MKDLKDILTARINLIGVQIEALEELGQKKGWTTPVVTALKELRIERTTLQWVLRQI